MPASGAALRDQGIARAVEHAEVVNPGWADDAYAALLDFIADRKALSAGDDAKRQFMAEDVRERVERDGLPPPPDPRAWGGVFGRARGNHKIKRVGFGVSENPQAHRRPTAIWRAI